MDRQTDKHWDVKMAANTIKVIRVALLSKISYPANNLRVNSDKTYGGRSYDECNLSNELHHTLGHVQPFCPFSTRGYLSHTDMAIKKKK